MKKLYFAFFFLFSFSLLSAQSGPKCDFHIRSVVDEASCWNNGTVTITAVDGSNNPLYIAPTTSDPNPYNNLSTAKYGYQKISVAGDTVHWSQNNILSLDSGRYLVIAEVLCCDSTIIGEGRYTTLRDSDIVNVVLSYELLDIYRIPDIVSTSTSRGYAPSLPCFNTGRQQFSITGGKFPYMIRVHNTDLDKLDTIIFTGRQYTGSNNSYYNYKDYYSVDSLAPGHYDFYVEDGCGYKWARITANVGSVEPPTVTGMTFDGWSTSATDSNVIKTTVNVNIPNRYYLKNPEYLQYRFIHKDINGITDTTEWKTFNNFGSLNAGNNNITVDDIVSNAHSYCDIRNKEITFEARSTVCDRPYSKTQTIRFNLDSINSVAWYYWSGSYADSNVLRAAINVRHINNSPSTMPEIKYRFIHKSLGGSPDTTGWKYYTGLGSKPLGDITIDVFDTIASASNYCDIFNDTITIEAQLTSCYSTVFKKISHIWEKPLYSKFITYKRADTVVASYVTEHYDSCGFIPTHPVGQGFPYYYIEFEFDYSSIANKTTQNLKNSDNNFQATYPLTWIYTDTSTGNIIKTEILKYKCTNSHHDLASWTPTNSTHWGKTVSVLSHYDVEPIYGSLYDTSYTIPVRRTLIDGRGCVLHDRVDNLSFELNDVVDDYPATPQNWTAGYEKNGDQGCSTSQRYVYVKAVNYSQYFSDGTVVRLIESPLGNKYNFTAVYDLASNSWDIHKDSLSNLADIVPVSYDNIRILDYNLPSGTYRFSVTTQCGTYDRSVTAAFSNTYSWEVATMPSYTKDSTCTSLTITPTAGQYRLYSRNTNASGPTETSKLINMTFKIIAKLPKTDPQNTFSTSAFTIGENATITAPGRYVIQITPYSDYNTCSPPTLYDTINFAGGTVSFKYALGYVCNASSTTGYVRAKAADGTPPYTYTLYSGPDKSGTVMDANGIGVFDNVDVHSGQVVSVGVQDNCMAAFHVNMTIYEMEQLNKAWFPGEAEMAEVCEGHYINFYAVGLSDDVSYHWTGPDGYTSDTRDTSVFIPRSSTPGWYKVVISNTGCDATISEDSVYVDVVSSPWVEILRDTIVCPGQPVTVQFIPHGTGVVNYTISYRENNTVTHTNYNQPESITFSPTSSRSYWVSYVEDDSCSYTIADDTVKISVNDHIATSCDVITLSEPICHSTDGEVFASSTLAVPYYVKWYRDPEQTQWLRTDTIYNVADYASYAFTGLQQDTSLYVTVSNSEYCESRYGTVSAWKNMMPGTVSLHCGESIKLFDDGGQDHNYSPDQDLFQTFTSSDGEHLTISFEALNIDPGDKLLVYSGAAAHNDSLLAELTGDLTGSLPGPFVSAGSILTLRFLSNHTTQRTGFQAVISNNPKPAAADLHVLDTLSTELVIPHVQVHYDGNATVTANAEGGRGDSYRYSWEISVDGGGTWTSLGDSISGSSANLYLNHVTQPTHVRVSISDASANPCVGTAQADIFIPVSNVQLTLDLSIPDLQQCESDYPATVTVKNHKPGTAHNVTVKLGLPDNVVPLNPDDTLIALGDIAGNDSVFVTINLHNGLVPAAAITLPMKAQIWSCSEGDSVPTVLYGDWDWSGAPRQADEDVDSLSIKPVMSLVGYHLTAQDDAVCYNGTATLRATSDVDMPQYIRWYADPALHTLLKIDTLNTTGESSEYTIEHLVRDTTLYITIENDGFCPAIDSAATYAKLDAPATQTMNLVVGSTLVGMADKIKFYDTGGPTGNYGNNENIVHTFSTSSGQVVLRLNSINIGAGDRFFIYNGPTATGAPIYMLVGSSSNSNAQVFTSTGGTLTVAIYSNGTSVAAGWDADIASSTNYLSAVATASLRTVYEDITLTATDDTVCIYNDAALTARSDNAVYFTWLADDQKTIVLQDTAMGHESTLPVHYVLNDSTFYVAAIPAGACPVIPTSIEQERILNLASSNTGRETHLLPTDRIRFFDDGGASLSYLPEKHVFTHTFTGLQGKVKLTFANNGMLNTADTLYVYDGAIGSGTLMGKYTASAFRNQTFTSTTNQLSVKFANNSGTSNTGWDATVTTSYAPHIVQADVTIKQPLNIKHITATHDIVCYDNTATLYASSDIAFPQYYSWYKNDGKTLLQQDTVFASGNLSTFQAEHQVKDSLYYVTIYNDTACPYLPAIHSVYLRKETPKVVRANFLFNSSKNGGTTNVTANDSIPFYDEGGPSGNYSTNNISWIHTFTSQTGNVVLKLDEFNSQGTSYDYLIVYDGSTASGRTLGGNYQGRIGGNLTSSCPIILTSSGNSLTVQWTTNASTNQTGWKGSVYSTYNDTLLAPSTVHIKAPLRPDYITTTNDTVCYDNTATLHATSDIAFPQYYSWYKDDGKTLLHRDTAFASGDLSTFQPEHQIRDSLYYVVIYNDTSCPYIPAIYNCINKQKDYFLFNSSKNGGTTLIQTGDSIPFFDEGGPNGNYSTNNITWTHTFTSQTGNVILKLDEFNSQGTSSDYLIVYDDSTASGITLGGNYQGRIGGTPSCPIILTSSGNSLTVQWTTNASTNRAGWKGSVYTTYYNDTVVAPSTVHIKAPLTTNYITATHDTVCYDNTATLHASSDIAFPQYYSWYNEDGKTLLYQDTAFTAGDFSTFQPTHQVRNSMYYVTINNDTTCPYLPAIYNWKTSWTDDFLFNESKNGGTTYLVSGEIIPFYDEGGYNSYYSTTSITWTHTFTSLAGNVVLKLDEFHSQGAATDYLIVYDGSTASGRTLGGDSQGRIGGNLSSSCPIILTSSGNSLTVQWRTNNDFNYAGWRGSVSSTYYNDTLLAPSTVHIKVPLTASNITATHDTVCYDNTATLHASSDIAFPQYYTWYKDDGKTLLYRDTAFSFGEFSTFKPEHQKKNSLYFVAVQNSTSCPYQPNEYNPIKVENPFLFNAEKNNKTTHLSYFDYIPFFDEGGSYTSASTQHANWTHTFIAEEGNVVLKLEEFSTHGTGTEYLIVYDGSTASGRTLGGDSLGRLDGNLTSSCPIILTSSGNSMTIQFVKNSYNYVNWMGAIYSNNDAIPARSTVHIKAPLDAHHITTTHDTVCYDNTATLHAFSDIAFPLYYEWYKDDGKTLLQRDTIHSVSETSTFNPTHQKTDSLYFVTIQNDTSCPYIPEAHNPMKVKDVFLFDANKNRKTTLVPDYDPILFYDEGGPNGDYIDINAYWTHTFIAESGKVVLKLDEFNTDDYDYLYVYDADLDHANWENELGRTVNPGGLKGDLTSSCPLIFTSSGNALTVCWSASYSSLSSGWKGLVYTTSTPKTISARSTVHIKKPLNTNYITTTHDTVCYDNTATLHASSDIAFPQYYAWYKDDTKTLLYKDTASASGDVSTFHPEHQTKDSLYYVTIYNDTTCPYVPDTHDLIMKLRRNLRENFLFNSSKNGGITHIQAGDSIPFYDEGGPNDDYSTNSITWTHTFTSPTGNVVLKLNEFYSQSTSSDYLMVYDGSTASGETLGGNSSGRIGGDLSSSCPIILTSSGNSLTVQWRTNANYTAYRGWKGFVYSTYNDTLLAPSTVHIKVPLGASYLTATNDTVCFDNTAILHATSDIKFPQYYAWYKDDGETLLQRDTAFVKGDISTFRPEHQKRDSLYYVSIHNDINCPFVPHQTIPKIMREDFLFNASKDSNTTMVHSSDIIPFYDEGGATGYFYTGNIDWTHTFSTDTGTLNLELTELSTPSMLHYLVFYDGPSISDSVLGHGQSYIESIFSGALPPIFSSKLLGDTTTTIRTTGKYLTVQWHTSSISSGSICKGFSGYIYNTIPNQPTLETSAVKVCPVNFDTVYQATCQSSIPYNYDNFHNVDVSSVGTLVIDSLYQNQYGCDSTVTLILTVNPTLALSAISSSHCRNLSDGYIDLTVGAGSPPFEIQWSGKASGSHSLTAPGSYRIENLPDSIYDITVTDAKGCSATLKDTVSQIDDTLTITANSHAFDYDGTAHTDNGFTVDFGAFSGASASGTVTLHNGDIVNATITGSITEVSESPKPNVVTAYSVYRGADDVTCEYAVKTLDGQLTINAVSAPLLIKSPSCVWDYNGKYDSCTTTYTVTFNGTDVPECTACTPPAGSWQYVLPTNDTVTISDPIRVRDVTDTANTFTLRIQNGATYTNVDTVYGNIRVNPVSLTINTDSSEKIFDGLPLTAHSWLNNPPVGLAPGDSVVWVDIYGSITDMGDSLNRAHPIAVIVNTSTGDTVTSNYNISYNFGTLSVYGALAVLAAAAPDSIQSVTCNGSDDGSGTFVLVGGKPGAHTYSLDGGTDVTITSDTIKLTHLTSGNHTLAVTDLMGNTDTLTFTVGSPEPLVAQISVPTDIADRCPNQGTYTVTVNVTGGTKPYKFVWGKDANNVNDTITTVTQTLSNDCGKEYEVTILVTDTNLCTAKDTARFSVIDTVKPTISTTAVSGDKGCNPTITAPTFTLSDNCDAATTVPTDSITVTGPTHTGCAYTQSWTAHYTDACGNKAKDTTITYTWTVDTEVPVISTTAVSGDKGCNPTITAPTFTLSDNCDATTTVPTDSITVTGPSHTGCAYTQSWTAHYTDACGNKAKDTTITYTWTVDTEVPVISTTAVSGDKGCNPTITAPTFTLSDNCDAATTVPTDSITVTGPTHTGCAYTQSWTAHYTDACGNKAKDTTITYTWTVDTEVPVISTTAVSGDKGCNPTITAPTFTLSDNCDATTTVPTDSVTVTGPTHTGCAYTQSWTAHYTDACGNKAKDTTITYTWTVDTEVPVISTTAVSGDKGCNPTITAPTFTLSDNCDATTTVPTDSVTVTGPTNTGCIYTQSWTAHYTDACGNKAKDTTITYTWTQTTIPTIITSLTDKNLGCDPTIVAPTSADFTVKDGCNSSATATVTAGTETISGYTHSQTWTATYKNACNQDATPISITYTWIISPSTSITCAANMYDTLDFGDCFMKINPDSIKKPTVVAPTDWPYTLSSDIPADSLYHEGDNVITWIMKDTTCGYADTCFQHIFITFPKCPDATDCEGNVYHGVRIDCDCWTQRNLESTKYSDCTDIPCVYEYVSELYPNVTENVDRYGRLYCYDAAVRDSADNGHGHIQGICPAGWYLPTPEKYESLNLHGADALRSPLYWLPSGGSNTTGFTALPAGRYNGISHRYEGLRGETYFWSTAGVGSSASISVFMLLLDCQIFIETNIYEGLGYSVRCIKEKE